MFDDFSLQNCSSKITRVAYYLFYSALLIGIFIGLQQYLHTFAKEKFSPYNNHHQLLLPLFCHYSLSYYIFSIFNSNSYALKTYECFPISLSSLSSRHSYTRLAICNVIWQKLRNKNKCCKKVPSALTSRLFFNHLFILLVGDTMCHYHSLAGGTFDFNSLTFNKQFAVNIDSFHI